MNEYLTGISRVFLKAPSPGLDIFRKVNQDDYTEKMPTYPGRVLAVHVIGKGVQVGSAFALIAVAPIIAVVRRRPLMTMWRTWVLRGSLLGGVGSSCVLYYKDMSGNLDIPGVDDRAYRLRKNKFVTNTEKYGFSCAAAGATTGVIAGGNILALAAAGYGIGFIVYGLQRTPPLSTTLSRGLSDEEERMKRNGYEVSPLRGLWPPELNSKICTYIKY
jgi:Protein of unknown function (DUF1757)